MNKLYSFLTQGVLVALAILLAACGSAVPAAQAQTLDTTYENALAARSQLLLGTIRLEESGGPALSKAQVAKLLPLWRASKSLTASGTGSQAEQDAITNQILGVMTPEQIQAIRAMRLTQSEMQAFNQSIGATSGTRSGSIPGGVPGQGQSLSPAERATRQAQQGGTSGNTAALDYLVKILERKANE